MRRYSFYLPKQNIEDHFKIQIQEDLKLSYQVTPRQMGYAILDKDISRVRQLIWGLIPADSKDGANDGRLIHARGETISTQPSFRMPIREKRCLVLADSYYEWNDHGLKKYPYRVVPHDNSILVMAGIWDVWQSGSNVFASFSIVSTKSNGMVNKIAGRMPVVLETKKKQTEWLSDLSLKETMSMIQPPNEHFLKVYRITEKANNSKYDAPDLHKEVPIPLNKSETDLTS